VRRPREHGRSAWTVARKVEYLMDSVFSFTDLPIRLLVRVGGLAAIIAGLFGVATIIFKLLGVIDVPGFSALAVLIVFFGALNLFGLGIIGSYAWRTYENTKERPHHLVLRAEAFGGGDDAGKGEG